MILYILGMLSLLIPFIIFYIFFYYIIIKQYKKSEYFRITHISYFSMRSDPGRAGEYFIYKDLAHLLGEKRFLFNCYIPDNNGTTTEIDVLLIHESGIYVFESKNYSGWIFGSETQKNWTQSFAAGHGKGKIRKESFFNPIWQNKKHVKWLQEYLKDSSLPIYSYIVFGERCELKKLNLKNQEHIILKRNNMISAVSAKASATGSVLSLETVDKIYKKLYPLSQADTTTKNKHIQNINAIKTKQNNKINITQQNLPKSSDINNYNSEGSITKCCPRCGGKLVLRTATKGQNAGKKFYGCSSYPYCRYTENIT